MAISDEEARGLIMGLLLRRLGTAADIYENVKGLCKCLLCNPTAAEREAQAELIARREQELGDWKAVLAYAERKL